MSRSTVNRRRIALPAVPTDAVPRPRLAELLERLKGEARVVSVTATAGSGKTTAVASAVRELECPVAWLTLDASNRAPGRLLVYLEAALASVVPEARDAATGALAAGLAHEEAAGLLGDSVGEVPVALVLDETERLEDDRQAWAIVEALERSLPASACVILIGRDDPRISLPLGETALLGDGDLAFDVDEAAAALARRGAGDIDPAAAVDSTGGWVTGVLFEIWRLDDHVPGMGGEADPLFGYLSSNILAGLTDQHRDLLVLTSPLEEVDAAGARALRGEGAEAGLAALSTAHLPASWDSRRGVMSCHPRFREYLLELLARRGAGVVAEQRRRHGRYLAAQGRYEEAAMELLAAGDAEEAAESAARIVLEVVQRGDYALAEEWLERTGSTDPAFATAELMLSLANYDLARATRVADELLADPERLAQASDTAKGLIAWIYLHQARERDVNTVLDGAEPGPAVEAARHAARAVIGAGGARQKAPELTGGIADAIVFAADYSLGRLAHVAAASKVPWVDAVGGPWVVAATRAMGRTDRALELYDSASGGARTALDIFVAPELLMDAGRMGDAREALKRGRALAVAGGSAGMMGMNTIAALRIALWADRDPALGRDLLERLESERGLEFGYFREVFDAFAGEAALLESNNAEARQRLRAAIDSMAEADRILEVPGAAVALSEAEWRAGEEEAADVAADLALDAARRQGGDFLLLGALGRHPAVLARRLDAELSADSPWHQVAAALRAQDGGGASAIGSIHVSEFGRRAILVAGEEVRPRIAKSHELLAYLATLGRRETPRNELAEVLFDGSSGNSTRAYLSQAIHQLRAVLPGDALEVGNGRVAVAEGIALTSDSTRFEALLAEAARLQGRARLEATERALEPSPSLPYLPGKARSTWVDERERRMRELAVDAHVAAGRLSYELGEHAEAREHVEAALTADRCREDACRLAMRMAQARADDAEVVSLYRDCEEALAEIGLAPSASTRRLLESLRG